LILILEIETELNKAKDTSKPAKWSRVKQHLGQKKCPLLTCCVHQHIHQFNPVSSFNTEQKALAFLQHNKTKKKKEQEPFHLNL